MNPEIQRPNQITKLLREAMDRHFPRRSPSGRTSIPPQNLERTLAAAEVLKRSGA